MTNARIKAQKATASEIVRSVGATEEECRVAGLALRVVMTDAELDTRCRAIIAEHGEIEPGALLAQLRSEGCFDSRARSAMWRVIDSGDAYVAGDLNIHWGIK